jgi:hypothetical protein
MRIMMSTFRGCWKMREGQEEMFGLEMRNRRMEERDREASEDMCLVLKQ